MDLDFSEDEIRRYSRHILLGEVGGTGQAKLKAARVLVVGAGGLGSPLVVYLAAAGVGTIGIVDDDVVELSNLQRQIAHTTARIGVSKVESAAMSARAINPEVRIEPHALRLNADNAMGLIERYDLVCDGTDNFATRFLVADACVLARRTLVSAAVLRFEGQLSVFKAHVGGAQVGVSVGGESLGGPDPHCALCGPEATIKDLSAHRAGVAGAGAERAGTAAACAV
jgi:molybdopterin-synthase adenylyltransferase